jgi:hypothetical protein
MFLWISGFLKGDVEDDALKYELTVKPQFETEVLAVLGWKTLTKVRMANGCVQKPKLYKLPKN